MTNIINSIPVYDISGKELSKIDIDLKPLDREVSKTYACAIRALRQNWRQGTVGCKTRKDLAFSNKKPWKQKGTGRARAGSLRSPLWRKGAVLFGPQPRTRELFINKKQNKLVLKAVLDNYLNNKNLYCLDFNLNDKPSTKLANQALEKLNLFNKKVVVFLPFLDEINAISFRNLANVNILSFDQPNAYDLSNCDCWVFLKKDVEFFKNMVESWN